MGDLIAELIVRLLFGAIELVVELVFRAIGWLFGSAAAQFRRRRRETRLGMRVIYGSRRRISDVELLDGPWAGRKLSEIPLDIVMSLQRSWPKLVGRAAIARWLDRNSPGWRRQRWNRGRTFIATPPTR